MGSATVKKPAALSRSAIDTKFTARGVSPRMIREATGVEKFELTQIRSLLAIFEEAHERNWDVAKGPWAHAVEFYQFAFQETLPEVEPGPRDSLIMDFVKRCWGIVLARDGLRIEPSSVTDVQATDDVVTTEFVASIPPKVSMVLTTEAQLLAPPAASSALAKFMADTGTDADAAYAAYAVHVAQLAERRNRELSGLNDDIEKVVKDREAIAAGQKRDRLWSAKALSWNA